MIINYLGQLNQNFHSNKNSLNDDNNNRINFLMFIHKKILITFYSRRKKS